MVLPISQKTQSFLIQAASPYILDLFAYKILPPSINFIGSLLIGGATLLMISPRWALKINGPLYVAYKVFQFWMTLKPSEKSDPPPSPAPIERKSAPPASPKTPAAARVSDISIEKQFQQLVQITRLEFYPGKIETRDVDWTKEHQSQAVFWLEHDKAELDKKISETWTDARIPELAVLLVENAAQDIENFLKELEKIPRNERQSYIEKSGRFLPTEARQTLFSIYRFIRGYSCQIVNKRKDGTIYKREIYKFYDYPNEIADRFLSSESWQGKCRDRYNEAIEKCIPHIQGIQDPEILKWVVKDTNPIPSEYTNKEEFFMLDPIVDKKKIVFREDHS